VATQSETGGRLAQRTGVLTELHRFDVLLLGLVIALTASTVVSAWVRIELWVTGLDPVLNTVTALAAAAASALAWVRYRAESQLSAAYESSAFLMLFATRGLLVLLALASLLSPLGLTTGSAEQWPIYGWTIARLGTAVLLLRAASIDLKPERRVSASEGPAVLLLPLAVIALLFAVLPLLEDVLPIVTMPSGAPPSAEHFGLTMTPAAIVVQAMVAGVYLWGASIYRQLFRLRGRRYAAYLSLALVIAAFSQVHWAIVPGIYAPVVTADDLLRAGMSFVLLVGIYEQSREDVARLRLANAELEEHRTAEAERAAREAAIARELHDGIAQELWLAKLKLSGVVGAPDLGPEARALTVETSAVVDRALEQARTAVSSLRARTTGDPLGESLADTVAQFAEQSGIRAELTGDVPDVSPRVASEIIRIVGEALANVLKHADATVVRVSVRTEGSATEVSIADNGKGFAVAQANGTGYGVRGMRERAALIGGDIDIVSKPQDGTRVVLRVNLGES
jgi:signal transduction histidine kinase